MNSSCNAFMSPCRYKRAQLHECRFPPKKNSKCLPTRSRAWRCYLTAGVAYGYGGDFYPCQENTMTCRAPPTPRFALLPLSRLLSLLPSFSNIILPKTSLPPNIITTLTSLLIFIILLSPLYPPLFIINRTNTIVTFPLLSLFPVFTSLLLVTNRFCETP